MSRVNPLKLALCILGLTFMATTINAGSRDYSVSETNENSEECISKFTGQTFSFEHVENNVTEKVNYSFTTRGDLIVLNWHLESNDGFGELAIDKECTDTKLRYGNKKDALGIVFQSFECQGRHAWNCCVNASVIADPFIEVAMTHDSKNKQLQCYKNFIETYKRQIGCPEQKKNNSKKDEATPPRASLIPSIGMILPSLTR